MSPATTAQGGISMNELYCVDSSHGDIPDKVRGFAKGSSVVANFVCGQKVGEEARPAGKQPKVPDEGDVVTERRRKTDATEEYDMIDGDDPSEEMKGPKQTYRLLGHVLQRGYHGVALSTLRRWTLF
ncbi:hypothetical protein DOTSEDRAFT_19387 [Dothistroma septosporum NZE10]|uniref:Uncharacterized protein n=1 Tax=Dothistroma septosporum (strain NZE10 / CBS 128990) TaxID=675120 RepID=N1PZM3_DOTSN|nr:hypothetical protein DOTSEDRAFT_19387 [Dothistroma septosporum NZE10]